MLFNNKIVVIVEKYFGILILEIIILMNKYIIYNMFIEKINNLRYIIIFKGLLLKEINLLIL